MSLYIKGERRWRGCIVKVTCCLLWQTGKGGFPLLSIPPGPCRPGWGRPPCWGVLDTASKRAEEADVSKEPPNSLQQQQPAGQRVNQWWKEWNDTETQPDFISVVFFWLCSLCLSVPTWSSRWSACLPTASTSGPATWGRRWPVESDSAATEGPRPGNRP